MEVDKEKWFVNEMFEVHFTVNALLINIFVMSLLLVRIEFPTVRLINLSTQNSESHNQEEEHQIYVIRPPLTSTGHHRYEIH